MTAHAARFIRLAAAAALAAAALPAAADAAVFTQPPGRCYVAVGSAPTDRQSVPVAATGFTPDATVDILIDGAPADSDANGMPDTAVADPAGKVIGSVRAPVQARGERTFTLTLTQHDNAANTVSATSRITALELTMRPDNVPPSTKVRYRGRGFLGKGPLWAHYLFAGRVRKTVRLARHPGECGTFDVRRRQIPITRPRIGRWIVQVDRERRYAPQPSSVWLRLAIDVAPVVGTR